MSVLRRLRIIEYTGESEWLDDCIRRRYLKGEIITPHGSIRESWLGDTSELLDKDSSNYEYRRTERES